MNKKFLVVFFVCSIAACDNIKDENNAVSKSKLTDTLKQSSVLKLDSTYSGEVKEYYPKGELKMEGYMKVGKREGLWKSYYPDGSLCSEGTYKQGKQYGKSVSYFQNGQKQFEGLYEEGNPAGKWIFWDETGKVKKETVYE